MSLSGRTIIITGGAQGIGLAAAKLVADLGGNLVLVDMNAENLGAARDAIGTDTCLTVAGNVSDPAFAPYAVAQAVARFGAVDGLVNNAGITRTAMADKMTLEQWQQVIEVHLTGSFLFLQAAGRRMIEQAKPGAIVNISSDAGVQGTIGQINYGTAKSGILGMTMSAAREWARHGINVNCVAFGVVETQMTETLRGEKFRDTMLSKIPLRRWSSAEEAAMPICFLLSGAASYITGQRLSANGGHQMSA
ncbi:3-oxoacyl-[acyl-carrier protein] reductase [Sphingopyxis panaciterrae]|uniref:SDR family NAD(P)-dependent oxidoreductase n=1 Tax=Sphingopyxis panaciterrae TaxID=363841 RepID=UPI001FB9E8A3|nr:SDR family NAD(P)-dependent oxidoreductase [Sphingopyxis panaciterrae]NIJ37584.1 3-oxoacyl-[acyl-carrier protein] reductase [Sphingopyxis panaciterrae]